MNYILITNFFLVITILCYITTKLYNIIHYKTRPEKPRPRTTSLPRTKSKPSIEEFILRYGKTGQGHNQSAGGGGGGGRGRQVGKKGLSGASFFIYLISGDGQKTSGQAGGAH